MNRRTIPRCAVALLTAVIALVALVGCASARDGGSDTGHDIPITGSWQLVGGSDESGAITPGDAAVTLTLNGQNSGGHGPCNSFGATVSGATTGPITIKIGIHTEIACIPDDLNTTEARYFAALDKITTAAGANGKLVLSGGGDSLQFTRAKK